MKFTVARLSIVALGALASGCITDQTIDLIAADPSFTPKPVTAPAQRPTFRVGDIFHFKDGGTLVAEKVVKIDGDGVWWRDNLDRQWVGGEGALIPARAVARTDDGGEAIKGSVESTGDLYPLTIGKTVSFRATEPNWLQGKTVRNRTCTVEDFGTLRITSGSFDTWRIQCVYDGHVRFNYYAPALGRVVLQTQDTLLDSVQRELIGFDRGPAEPLRTASGPVSPAAGPDKSPMHKTMAKKVAAAPKPVMRETPEPAPARLTAASEGRYGIQLAAYRSPTRIRKAWSRIQRRGGSLLADFKPQIEQRDGPGVPLFRLVVGQFATLDDARAHCRSLKRKGIDCWPRARAAGEKPVATARQRPAAES